MNTEPATLGGIFIYPVKSLRGVSLEQATLAGGRLPGDRLWVVVDLAGRFLHQRDYPQMARVEAMPTADGIRLSSIGMPPIELSAPAVTGDRVVVEVRLWRRGAPAVHVDPEADAWLTAALGVRCRLLAFAPERPASDVPESELASALHDATPIHLTSESSLADLNRRTRYPVPMDRFRPNLVLRGAPPYLEDEVRAMAIGDNVFRWVRPCTRCVMTTTDQATGERVGNEPLAALARYRRQGQVVLFGHYLVAERWGGVLRVGDPVRFLDVAAV